MKGRSCATNLLEFLEKATASVDEGKPFDVVFLDFSKAFDKVPIARLLEKIAAHGIQGNILEWIKCWLTDRKQRVVLNGKFSTWMEVLSGVPQGSVLGPLLFTIFINDLDEAAVQASILRKFADDTKVGHEVLCSEDGEELQRVLDKLVEWTNVWGMAFNATKCKVMHMGNKNIKHKYRMEDHILEVTRSERDIGVIVQDNLKPTEQCTKAAKTARAVLNQIARTFHFRDRHIFVRLYKQYVRPHLEFSTQAWSPWSEADKQTLEKVQKKAIGMVTGLRENDYLPRLKELELETLEERRHQADMVMMHKVMHGVGGLDHATWFEKANVSNRVTRVAADDLNVKLKHGRLEMRRNFFSVRAAKAWNEVPAIIKRAASSDAFKRAYKQCRSNRNMLLVA